MAEIDAEISIPRSMTHVYLRYGSSYGKTTDAPEFTLFDADKFDTAFYRHDVVEREIDKQRGIGWGDGWKEGWEACYAEYGPGGRRWGAMQDLRMDELILAKEIEQLLT